MWKKSNVLLIGNPSFDEIVFDGKVIYRVGGGIYYSLKVLKKIPLLDIDIITSTDPYIFIKLSSLTNTHRISIYPSKTPFYYKLVYRDSDRVLYLLEKSNKLLESLMGSRIYDLAIVTPIYNEVMTSLLKKVWMQSEIVAIDIQGFIREKNYSGKIHYTCSPVLYDLIDYADIIHMNMDEATYFIKCLELGSLEELIMYNDLLFIISDSWRPLYIIFDKQILMIKPIRVQGDETGAGDTYLSAFSIYYYLLRDVTLAAKYASSLTTQKILYGDIKDINDLESYMPREIKYVERISYHKKE
ncbi:MAG: hypothetical protein DRO40_09405 [Thermoprotei archaeon]|nr:MAG: hypothetical protein DRO40_09405 [Thermoprotei archaeon]